MTRLPPPTAHTGVLGYFVRHHTAANLLLMIMLVAGLFASTRIRAQFFPDVAIDTIRVSIAWSGAAVGLCLLESPAPLDRPVLVAGVWFAVLVAPVLFADSLLLDLRDRAADRAFGLHTIAVRIGPRGVLALVAVMLAVAAITTLTALGSFAILAELDEEWLVRVMLALAIVAARFTLVVPILAKMRKADAPAEVASTPEQLVLMRSGDRVFRDDAGVSYRVERLS